MSNNIFVENPTNMDISRSVFDRSCNLKTSFDMGKLIPIYIDEVLPGDTISMDMAEVIRMGTPIAPLMDDLYAKFTWFFVPYRILWTHWVNFCGQNDSTAWTQTKEYTMPFRSISAGVAGAVGSLADYLGLPVSRMSSGQVCDLPFRAYYKIWNDWFRDENNQNPVVFELGDSGSTYNWYSALDVASKGSIMPVAKEHDLFTSCLPAPQKGPSVSISVGDTAPLKTQDIGYFSAPGSYDPTANFASIRSVSGGLGFYQSQTQYPPDVSVPVKGIVADLSEAIGASINSLRLAFQTQKFLERNARGGTRYPEFIYSHFNVKSPDATQQRSELLAEYTVPIVVDQVLSTTNNVEDGKTANNLLGTTGAFSKTVGKGSAFTYSATEHGYLVGCVLIRQRHTYSQGVPKLFLKKNLLDHYFPVFANIGEQPVSSAEIFYTAPDDISTFGFQEAWYEYRYKQNSVTGLMRPDVENALNYWTLADDFENKPVLGSDFIQESTNNLTRALAAGSTTYQFIADFFFKGRWARPMPVHSIPGLIDHH